MALSESDIRMIAGFVRKATKAPNIEAVISVMFETLKATMHATEIRVVHSGNPSTWNEWRATATTIELRPHDEWPAPPKGRLTVPFDPGAYQCGYVSVDKGGSKAEHVLEILAPGICSALLLQAALTRVQKAGISETELVRATLRARDEERRHIASELHDDIGQSMASLKLALKWAEDLVQRANGNGKVVKELSHAREQVETMMDKVRDLSHTLYPRILDTFGLSTAVKDLADKISRHSSMEVKCTTQGKTRQLDKDISVALYRCCQEAISNAIRHSNASKLQIEVGFASKEVRVTVQDDGKGFNPRSLYGSNARMMSSGFWTIRQRMADLRGAFRVSTAEGHGTVIEMIVPYSSRKAHATRKNKTAHRG